MCGIVGLVSFEAAPDRVSGVVAAMAERVERRRHELEASKMLVDDPLREAPEDRHHERHEHEAKERAEER